VNIHGNRLRIFIVFPLLAILACCTGPVNDSAEIGESGGGGLVGTWRFVSMEARSPSGEVTYPYGENIFGRLIYTTEGLVSVLLMNPDRPSFALDDPLAGTPEEIEAAYRGFDAYCGSFEVDTVRATITHHIEASKFPNWIGTDQVRSFEIQDDRLKLKADIETHGEVWKFEADLERVLSEKRQGNWA
jgi:hypothetical protein